MNRRILLNDKLLINVVGKGELYDYFCYQYSEMNVDVNHAEFEIDLYFGNLSTPKFENKLAFDGGFIARAGDQLYWTIGDSFARLEGISPLSDTTRILFSGPFPKMKMNNLLEMVFRLLMSKKGIFLVHGAGVARENSGVLLPAWKGVGKTALCLSLVARNFSFLADDRLWVDSEGWLIGNQRYVVIQDSNAHYFPQFVLWTHRLRRSLLIFFESSKRVARSRLFRLFKRLLRVKPVYYKIRELYPDCCVTRKVLLKSVVYMSKSHLNRNFSIGLLKASRLQQKISNISLFEWNLDIMKVASARDTLFDSELSWTKEIDSLAENEKQGLLSILKSVDCYEINLPSDLSSWEAAAELIINS